MTYSIDFGKIKVLMVIMLYSSMLKHGR